MPQPGEPRLSPQGQGLAACAACAPAFERLPPGQAGATLFCRQRSCRALLAAPIMPGWFDLAAPADEPKTTTTCRAVQPYSSSIPSGLFCRSPWGLSAARCLGVATPRECRRWPLAGSPLAAFPFLQPVAQLLHGFVSGASLAAYDAI